MARVGAYEITGTIASGGTATVLAARSSDGRAVAVKILRVHHPDALARFEREVRLLASFGEAEGFVPLLDSGSSSAGPWLAMPLLRGGTLRERLERGPLDPAATLALARDLARALARAHERGVVHRDLKPENIFFAAPGAAGGDPGRPLVGDLGLAKHFDEEALGASRSVSVSRSGIFVGTAAYMAPEQTLDAKNAGPAADVFALGAILHECLTGKPAFTGGTVLEILASVNGPGPAPPSSAGVAGVPRALEAAIMKALAPDPSGRIQDACAFVRQLEGASGAARRAPLVLAGLVGLALVLVGVVAGLALARRDPGDAPRVLVAPPPPVPSAPSAPSRAPSATPTKAAALVAQARDRLQAHDATGALGLVDDALQLDPANASAHAVRSMARGYIGDRSGAREDALRATELGPRVGEAWFALALVHRTEDDLERTAAAVDKAIEVDPGYAIAYEARASIRSGRGDQKGALADATRATELAPQRALAWNNLGTVRGGTDDFAGSIEACSKAIALDARCDIAYFNRGRAYAIRGEVDAALADYDRAVELNPGFASAWTNRADLRNRKGEYRGALADAEKALSLTPNSVNAVLCRAIAREGVGDLVGARKDYEAFLARTAPDDPRAAELRRHLAELR